MSARNKIENKKARKLARENKATRLVDMEPSTDIPLDVSASVLVNPKEKLSRSARTTWLRSRDRVFQLAKKESQTEAEKAARRLRLLPLVYLLRFRFKSARRAATASYLARKLHESSTFRPALIAEVKKQVALCHLAQDELNARPLVAAKL